MPWRVGCDVVLIPIREVVLEVLELVGGGDALVLAWVLLAISAVSSSSILPRAIQEPLAACPGYKASNIKTSSSTLTADLTLAGPACNVYGDDLKSLTLQVVYETSKC